MNIEEKIKKVADLHYKTWGSVNCRDEDFEIIHAKLTFEGVNYYKHVVRFHQRDNFVLGCYTFCADLFDTWDGSDETWNDYYDIDTFELGSDVSDFDLTTLSR